MDENWGYHHDYGNLLMISVALIFERMLILEVVRGAPTSGCSWDIFYGCMESMASRILGAMLVTQSIYPFTISLLNAAHWINIYININVYIY